MLRRDVLSITDFSSFLEHVDKIKTPLILAGVVALGGLAVIAKLLSLGLARKQEEQKKRTAETHSGDLESQHSTAETRTRHGDGVFSKLSGEQTFKILLLVIKGLFVLSGITVVLATVAWAYVESRIPSSKIRDEPGRGGADAKASQTPAAVPPTFELSSSVQIGLSPLEVSLKAIADGPRIPEWKWKWNFDDGTLSSEQNPKHVYRAPGKYQAQLTVTSHDGVTASKAIEILVLARLVLKPFAFPDLGTAPLKVRFVANHEPEDRKISKWTWEFEKGKESQEATPTHVFSTAGMYFVHVTATDLNGMIANGSLMVNVLEPLPPATLTTVKCRFIVPEKVDGKNGDGRDRDTHIDVELFTGGQRFGIAQDVDFNKEFVKGASYGPYDVPIQRRPTKDVFVSSLTHLSIGPKGNDRFITRIELTAIFSDGSTVEVDSGVLDVDQDHRVAKFQNSPK